MAEQQPVQEVPKQEEGEKKRGFGRAGGDKDRKPRQNRDPRKKEENEWKPVTKLGRLVKAGLLDNIIDIFRFSIPIKESEIIDSFLAGNLKE